MNKQAVMICLCAAWSFGESAVAGGSSQPEPIDRRALVARHAIEGSAQDLMMVGNGEFAFNADFTGLQSFNQPGIFAHWGWHTPPLPDGKHHNLHACSPKWEATILSNGIATKLDVPATVKVGNDTVPLHWWMATNPHRMNLGVLGFEFRKADGAVAKQDELAPASRKQRLDLWTGLLTSEYALGSVPVKVQTCVHPKLDAVAVRVESDLVRSGRMSVTLKFPYCVAREKVNRGQWASFYDPALPHTTVVEQGQGRSALLRRRMDEDVYEVRLSWKGEAVLKEVSPQVYELAVAKSETAVFEWVCSFSQTPSAGELPGFDVCRSASAAEWESFWRSGAAIDLSARETARKQGYRGARWQKQTGPGGWESPTGVGEFLIWQQPHAIFFADLDYRRHPNSQTLARWNGIVEDTAEFMASFVAWDEPTRTYRLGPGIKTMPENTNAQRTTNPAFDLCYWRYGLRVAQEWRERQGLARNPEWDKVLKALAPLPVQDGLYLQQEGMTNTYTTMNWEHPGQIGIYGMLPGDGVDKKIAHATVRKVFETWKWDSCWGWDFPMMAMAAARVGEPGMAIDALIHPSHKNLICANGFSRGGPYPYFPANGGLLYAIAMMAAGWDGCPEKATPGFPADGSWSVKTEGFRMAP